MNCSACGADNRAGRRFCAQCGAALEVRCANCGATNEPGDRFCGECGSPLQAEAGSAQIQAHAAAGTVQAVSQRRLVSVLFADLVGFTAISEHRDPEEVRDLLSRYFDRCRTLIERYAGAIEKFIGDAVMAVWGTPVAREDDAERAVRAGLALTQSIPLLGEEVGMPGLRVRAGVLTGNAAVEVGAEGEGMVLGDTVNTASRLQSLAAPGTVLVDDVTRRSTEAAIAYGDTGSHEVKGREQPVRAWTALRVVAGVGGALRGAGLEAPLVGRDRELETIIEAAEESAAEGRARHVTVTGEAGTGKTCLLWEFFKYLGGIKDVRYWHQGRCLSYGEGVAYWALGEMVRARAGIIEEEDAASARKKLRATVAESVPDERERRLVEPRLAHLLGLEQRTASDRADLFSGWRLFFERLSEHAPVILAFEDLQWADSGLLDFIDYVLEWSAERPLLVLALARLLRYLGRIEEARPLLEQFRASADGTDPIVRAEALCDLGAVLAFSGALDEAGPLLEEGLHILELEEAWPALANALVDRCVYLIYGGRRQEGTGVLRQALVLAEEHDLPAVALRVRANLAQLLIERDRFAEAVEEARRALVVARERGDRLWERQVLAQQIPSLFFLGRWDEAMDIGRPLISGNADLDSMGTAAMLVSVAAARGEEDVVKRSLVLAAERTRSMYTDLRVSAENVLARAAIERGEPTEALDHARVVLRAEGVGNEAIEGAHAQAIEAADMSGDVSAMRELEAFVAHLPPARATPLLRAGRARLQAELEHRAGDRDAAQRFEDEAIALLQSIGARPLLARALLERGRRHDDGAALAQARAISAELGATRWLERIGETSEVPA